MGLRRYLGKFRRSLKLTNVRTALKIALKESIELALPLAGSQRRIVMEVGSFKQLKRLWAYRKEPETVHWIETMVKTGEVFYDVGANVGAYSLLASARGARVVAFEPGFANYSALVKNAYLNHARIMCLPIACAEETKIASFHYSALGAGEAFHTLGRAPKSPIFSQEILAYRLDELIERFHLPLPQHVKIDVDGGELGVLRGLGEMLTHITSLFVEVMEPQSGGGDEVLRLLEAAGLYEASRKEKKKHNKRVVANYLFVRDITHG